MTSEPGVRVIYVIRHAEKPGTTEGPCGGVSAEAEGVTPEGRRSDHSLLPCGWQRAGALVPLFAPLSGTGREGLLAPAQLIAPLYTKEPPLDYRTHQTILPLSLRTGVEIESPVEEGEEEALGRKLSAATSGVTLVCWEHTRIHLIAEAIDTFPGTRVPSEWPGERFDVIWSFTREAESPQAPYSFFQIPQLLLAGDRAEVIEA